MTVVHVDGSVAVADVQLDGAAHPVVLLEDHSQFAAASILQELPHGGQFAIAHFAGEVADRRCAVRRHLNGSVFDGVLRERIDDGVAQIADGADPALLDEPLAMLRADRSTRETVELATAWSRDAIAALDPIPDGPVREALTRFAQAVADRSS